MITGVVITYGILRQLYTREPSFLTTALQITNEFQAIIAQMDASNTKQKQNLTQPVVDRRPKVNPDVAEEERRFLQEFPTDRACLDYLLRLRFGTPIKCPKCGRTAKFHKIRKITAYSCQWCGYHLYPMAQTRFARSRVGLRVWFHTVFLYSSGGNNFSACELQRFLGLRYKTARRMRNIIIGVKSKLPRHWNQEDRVDFQTLLAALVIVQT